MIKLKIESIDTINETAQKFIEQIGDRTIFAFNGKWVPAKQHS